MSSPKKERTPAMRKAQAKYYLKIKDDPEVKKSRLEYSKKWYNERKDDPEFKKKNRENQKKYYKKKMLSKVNNETPTTILNE